jgi:integral membrane protein
MSFAAAFRTVAIVEAITYVCLLAAIVAKRGFGYPEGVSIIGPVHGLAFVA